ncbi:MAG: glycoside hydrolase family 43 protein [Clostridia bacterium]|nr:glycoside hydrolase family 43 protein [Clostridia bacterium]
MLKRILTALAALCLALCLVPACAQEEVKFRNASVHDPSVMRAEDGTFYIYGSHMQAAVSPDLMQWKMISRNAENGCSLVENVQEEMREALSYAKTVTFWAPDVIRLADGRYYMYYCTCEGSSPLSALGLAVSDRPEGPFENIGIMLKSGGPGYDATQLPNAIDPNVFYDKDGKLWMVYGSYSGGIYILQMDEDTGFPLEGQGYGKKLLGKNHARIEAPYITYNPETGYYYLFLSFGGLNAADGYNIRVCRSENPDGPYVDALGQDMIDCGGRNGTYFNDPDYEPYGVKLMGGYVLSAAEGEAKSKDIIYRSPGHNSVYRDEETGQYFLIFHTRFVGRGESYYVRVHQMYFNDAGWPVVSPLRYAGETLTPVDEAQRAGSYKILLHERDINLTEHVSQLCELHGDGTITGAHSGSWTMLDGNRIELTLDGTTYNGVMNLGYDNDYNQAFVTTITAMDATGLCLWGQRIPDGE